MINWSGDREHADLRRLEVPRVALQAHGRAKFYLRVKDEESA